MTTTPFTSFWGLKDRRIYIVQIKSLIIRVVVFLDSTLLKICLGFPSRKTCLRHSERCEELILFKTNFDYCFTPSSRSFRFAIRKTFIHFFGATSDWVRVAHTASYAKSVLDFLHEKQSFIQFLNSTDFDYSGSRFSWLHFQTSSLSFRRKTPTYEFRSLRSTSLYRKSIKKPS